MPKIILKDINAIQTILGTYAASSSSKVLSIENEDNDDMPQTIIQLEDEGPECVASLGDLLSEKSKRCYYFLDHRKVKNKLWRIMYDFTSNGPLPASSDRPCWWCRHSFSTTPIGAPIKYNSHKTSGVEKERYDAKTGGGGSGSSDTNDFFETIGLFCSFPCCKAYILDQRGSIRFKESLSLLSLLFTILYQVDPDFPTAPTWKLLKDYGGHMSIQIFRQSFGVLEYTPTMNTRRPYMYNSSEYIKEKKVRLNKGIGKRDA